jgi:hypothetical protein
MNGISTSYEGPIAGVISGMAAIYGGIAYGKAIASNGDTDGIAPASAIAITVAGAGAIVASAFWACKVAQNRQRAAEASVNNPEASVAFITAAVAPVVGSTGETPTV